MLLKIGLPVVSSLALFLKFVALNEPAVILDIEQYEERNKDKPILDTVFDTARDRAIPFMIELSPYLDEWKGVVIFSHGYANNRPDAYLSYSYLIEGLRSRGYLVVSIQHELSNDPILPLKGNMQIVRRPFWENGALNIDKVYQNIVQRDTLIGSLPIILIGHSNGGDQSAFYCYLHPNKIQTLITLDNLRFNLTDLMVEKQLSIRSQDRVADSVVFENWEKGKTQYFQIDTVQVKHANMNDKGSINDKKEILRLIFNFLED